MYRILSEESDTILNHLHMEIKSGFTFSIDLNNFFHHPKCQRQKAIKNTG